MQLTKTQLKACVPHATQKNIDTYYPYLNEYMIKYDINTPQRVAFFLAQLAHESGSFRYVEEIASGAAYEGRKDLGNTVKGDGVRFKGRGLIQTTGRFNYKKTGDALGADFISNPDLLEQPRYAVESACWFWKKHGLNEIADTGNFRHVTKRINGGYNGLADRLKNLAYCKKALKIA